MNPNDPMSQFKERYQQYVETKAPSSPPVIHNSGKGFFNKFYVQGLIVGIVIIASSVLIYLNFKPDSKTASTQQKPVAVIPTSAPKKIEVSEAQIDAEMQRIWGQFYDQTKNDQKLREVAKNLIVKRMLVQNGILNNNVDFSSIASDNPNAREAQAENALSKKVLSWRNVDYLFIFLDPMSTKYSSNIKSVLFSYELVKKNMTEGKSMQEAYDLAKKDPGFYKGIILTKEKLFYKDDLDKSLADELFKYKKGQTTEIINPPGGTTILAYINDSNDTQYANLNEWLNSQK